MIAGTRNHYSHIYLERLGIGEHQNFAVFTAIMCFFFALTLSGWVPRKNQLTKKKILKAIVIKFLGALLEIEFGTCILTGRGRTLQKGGRGCNLLSTSLIGAVLSPPSSLSSEATKPAQNVPCIDKELL